MGHKCVVYTDNNLLSHLSTVKLGTVEQRWVAQLAAFDFELKYQSARSNQNVDALSRQHYPSPEAVASMAPGTALPQPLQQMGPPEQVEVIQAAINVVPSHTLGEIQAFQQADPAIQEAMFFWRQKQRPNFEEWKLLLPSVLVLLRQWDRLVEREGLLYRKVFHPDGAEAVFQLLLPGALIKEVLTMLHQEHGHQGVERTLALLRSRCYWPGMSSEVAQWCQACERCQLAKGNHTPARTFMGHLLASKPNEILALDFTMLEPAQNGKMSW